MNNWNDEVRAALDEVFYQGYYSGRDDEYAKGQAVTIDQALNQIRKSTEKYWGKE